MKKQPPQTTAGMPVVSKKFKVTHPFHPLYGHELEAINCRPSWGCWYVDFRVGESESQSIPLEWTDAGERDPFCEVSNGRSLFRIRELLELIELIENM